jgi:meso-butanediol dehydrogenase / (S,S)-butanediol dehydrogenase / diacetyl reductase
LRAKCASNRSTEPVPGRLQSQTAIVTGAASGIGECIARFFLAEGAQVFAVDRNPCSLAVEPDRFASLIADLNAKSAPATIMDACRKRFGRASILVNNAGVGGGKRALDTDDESWDSVVSANLTCAFRLTRAALPDLMESAGNVLNIASIFGLTGFRGTAAYAASKAGLVGLTRQLAADYGAHGVRVNALAPGVIRTPLTQAYIDGHARFRASTIGCTVLGRAGVPDDVAAAAVFLCSREASFITGEVLCIDGGWASVRHYPTLSEVQG